MTEQLDLADAPVAPPPAPSAWEWARAMWPGRKIIRAINLETEQQHFVVIEAEAGFLVDGSTHFVNSPAGGLSAALYDALVEQYDRAWHTDPHSWPSA